MQSKPLDQVQNKDIVLSGDGRCDSPGKSAKYCTYSLLDTDTGYILHCETIDKREVGLQSPNMEKEALVRSLQFLQSRICCIEIITDASSSIRREMGELTVPFSCIHGYTDVYFQLKSIQTNFIHWTSGTSLRK